MAGHETCCLVTPASNLTLIISPGLATSGLFLVNSCTSVRRIHRYNRAEPSGKTSPVSLQSQCLSALVEAYTTIRMGPVNLKSLRKRAWKYTSTSFPLFHRDADRSAPTARSRAIQQICAPTLSGKAGDPYSY